MVEDKVTISFRGNENGGGKAGVQILRLCIRAFPNKG